MNPEPEWKGYEPIPQHSHNGRWHEHAWTPGDRHSHGGLKDGPAEVTDDDVNDPNGRRYGQTIHEKRQR